MLTVRVTSSFTRRGEVIPPGSIIEIPDDMLLRMQGYVVPLKVESSASCRIDGGICRIRYTPDLYPAFRHRDGEEITIDGVPLTLKIEEVTI